MYQSATEEQQKISVPRQRNKQQSDVFDLCKADIYLLKLTVRTVSLCIDVRRMGAMDAEIPYRIT